MSYYSTLEVLALCDALDKVQSIRHDLHEQNKSWNHVGTNSSVDQLGSRTKIPKISNSIPQHDFLELDIAQRDKKRNHPIPRTYSDDVIKQQILSSSEAANSIQRRVSFLNQSNMMTALDHTNSNTHENNYQQQARSLQNKKALQHQHFQNSMNRLPGLSSPIVHNPIPKTPTPNVHSNNNSTATSRSSTPSHTPRIPHNAGTTSSDDGTQEECDFCKRVFRGPKSSTHKQQHIKRIHPDAYVRKRGGVKKSRSYTLNSF